MLFGSMLRCSPPITRSALSPRQRPEGLTCRVYSIPVERQDCLPLPSNARWRLEHSFYVQGSMQALSSTASLLDTEILATSARLWCATRMTGFARAGLAAYFAGHSLKEPIVRLAISLVTIIRFSFFGNANASEMTDDEGARQK